MACGAPEHVPVANAAPAGPPLIAAACPNVVQPYVWAHELFPGCPPMPFANVGITCARDRDCPHPCKLRWRENNNSDVLEIDVAYDAAGRWLSNTSSGVSGSPKGRHADGLFCSRWGDIGSCGYMADRDTTVVDVMIDFAGDRPIALSGNATARFEYDERDRLVRELGVQERVTTSYDARGRVASVTETDDGGAIATRFDYDEHDRVTRLTKTLPTGTAVTTYRYDALGRPVQFDYGATREDVTYCP